MFRSKFGFFVRRGSALAVLACLCMTAYGRAEPPGKSASSKVTPALTAEAILKAADRARGGDVSSGLTMESTITSYSGGEERRSYSVKIESEDGNSLVTFLKPAISRGTMMLVKSRNMWFLSPEVKRPVPISPRQRLLGQASNGDVATINFSDDYSVQLTGEADVDGTPCYVLALKAKEGQVTYDRITYYVSKDKRFGIRADYFTVSGKLFKKARFQYNNQITYGGKSEPFLSRTEIHDATNPSEKTVLEYKKPRRVSIPRARFQAQSLLSH